MTLSKRSNGLYYVWYIDWDGKRKKISTGTKLKQGATKFLVDFAHKQKSQESQPTPVTLSQFTQEFLAHSACVHAPKTSQVYVTALQELSRHVGNTFLSEVTPRVGREKGGLSRIEFASQLTMSRGIPVTCVSRVIKSVFK
jgi:hypothetical protein